MGRVLFDRRYNNDMPEIMTYTSQECCSLLFYILVAFIDRIEGQNLRLWVCLFVGADCDDGLQRRSGQNVGGYRPSAAQGLAPSDRREEENPQLFFNLLPQI